MADDVDDLLRRAMATLDRETPAGYFDELPGRTLARLDGAAAGQGEPGDELARERAARGARAAPGSSSSPKVAAPDAPAPPRRWRAVIALAATGLAAVLALMLFNATRMGAGAPKSALEVSRAASDDVQQERMRVRELVQSKPDRAVEHSSSGSGAPQAASTGRLDTSQLDGALLSIGSALAAEDFQAGMLTVSAATRRCFPPGPRGNAALEVTVFPSGEVYEVKVSPPYAGTPSEDCVERAVKSHRFPAWEGAPQTFRYRLPTSGLRSRTGDTAQDGAILK